MAVEIDNSRRAVEVTWDTSLVTGDTVDIKTSNDDDVSGRTGLKNDGRATLTFPADYKGSSHVVVTGSDGGEDSGDITV